MKKETRTVYICEHCGKKMFGASAMSVHEKFCRQNPNNLHKCFQYCQHLKKTGGEKRYDYEHDGFCKRNPISFTCSLLKKELYSYKLENKQRFQIKNILKNKERMPLVCDGYLDMQRDFDEEEVKCEFGDEIRNILNELEQ